jgi:hypothetical protein
MDKVPVHKWTHITDLDETAASLAGRGLPALAKIWQDLRTSAANSPTLERFLSRLNREWAIETGSIERLYTLDAGTTQILIERGFEASFILHADKPAEWIESILEDNRSALELLSDFVGKSRQLSTAFIRELHQLMTKNQQFVDAVDPYGNRLQVPLLRGE